MNVIARYARWLHTKWPSGLVEKLPVLRSDGRTAVPGLRVVGDLTGVPLLKLAVDSGAKAIAEILAEPDFASQRASASGRGAESPGDARPLDVAIVGGGVAGIAAAIAARKAGLNFTVFEDARAFSTIANFPVGKPIYAYPGEFQPAGDLSINATVKEALLEELEEQRLAASIEPVALRIDRVERRSGILQVVPSDPAEPSVTALRVVVAIGRSGSFRSLGVPGEERGKVSNRLHDPKDFSGQSVLVVGGGDSALETAVALSSAGAAVTLSYRKADFSRPKPDNIEALEAAQSEGLRIVMETQVEEIGEDSVVLRELGGARERETLGNDAVFTMLGREAPLDFFRRSGVRIHGEWRPRDFFGLALFLLFCVGLFHWKSYNWFALASLDPKVWWAGLLSEGDLSSSSLGYTILRSASGPSFYYTLAYSLIVGIFGVRRIRRRRTPYVTAQTITLMCVQWVPLFLLPEVLLPWMGRNGWFVDGAMLRPVADALIETYDGGVGAERAYWRAYGFILAWPLFVYNWFTATGPVLWTWAAIGSIQTFVLIPLMVFRWGKGAYCGWICSCGALAETLGDTQRHKMPHGPLWNRLNLVGQVILALAFVLLLARGYALFVPGSWLAANFDTILQGKHPWSYKWLVDVMLAGVLGVGVYFWFSGRVWCRFACPLAALMHIYARFSRFRIFADGKKCISCNVCTSVCHQGIDVMSFANKGLPMEDPQCVRCSACVQGCPTGTLSFGRLSPTRLPILDTLPASAIQLAEKERRNDR